MLKKKSFLLKNEEPSRNPTTCFAESLLKSTALELIISFSQNNTKTKCKAPKNEALTARPNKGARDDHLIRFPSYPYLNTICVQN